MAKALNGETNPSLTFSHIVDRRERGIIFRRVSNPAGSILSAKALLTVRPIFPLVEAFSYTNFSSTEGLTWSATRRGAGTASSAYPVARRTRKRGGLVFPKQFCAKGFATVFASETPGRSFLASNPAGDGISFTSKALTPSAGSGVGPENQPCLGANCLGVSLNTLLERGSRSRARNFVGITTNGAHWLVQRDLNGTPINLSDGNEHVVQKSNATVILWHVAIDGLAVITKFPVPLAQATDTVRPRSWVGFGARTGWAGKNHDVLSWSCCLKPGAACRRGTRSN